MADLVNLNNSASNSRHVPAILEQLVNSEVGGDSDLLDFLNSETQELKLNFDQNDLTSSYHTRYCTENEIIALSHTMLSNSYIPLIYTETNSYIWRFIYPRLIDNIFVNACPEISAGIITSDISDHFPIYALASNFVINYDHSNSYKSGFRDMSMTNLCKLRERLGLVDWSVVYNQTNTNLSFEMFYIYLYQITIASSLCSNRPVQIIKKCLDIHG